MNFPYSFRVMAALPGHEPVELMRSQKKYEPSYYRAAVDSMSRQWDTWVEVPLPERHCISPRPTPSRYIPTVAPFHLTHDEKRLAFAEDAP